MTIHIDGEKALSLLEECVRERGEDYVYPKAEMNGDCVYVFGTDMVPVDVDEYGDDLFAEQAVGELTPGCMVGLALAKAGVPLGAFLALEINREEPASSAIPYLREAGYLTATGAAIDVFLAAQQAQDAQKSWGEALGEATPLAEG